MRAVVLGYHDMGHDCLQVLLDAGLEVAAVYTHNDDPDEGCWFRSIEGLARDHGLPVFTPEDINDPSWVARLRRQAPDILFSFYYRRLVNATILEIPRAGCLNMHGSLLPRFRGRCPVNWALIRGERETGVTLHHMVLSADAGDIVGQRRIPIAAEDDAKSLHDAVVAQGADLLRELLPAIRSGTAPRRPQDPRQAFYCRGRRPADGEIDWSRPAGEIHDLVRGVTHPYPGARTWLRDRRLFVWKTRTEPRSEPRERVPGQLAEDGSMAVETGDGVLRLLRCQLEGESECDGADFARLHDIRAGAQLGAEVLQP